MNVIVYYIAVIGIAFIFLGVFLGAILSAIAMKKQNDKYKQLSMDVILYVTGIGFSIFIFSGILNLLF